jgi:aspartate aminotransferase
VRKVEGLEGNGVSGIRRVFSIMQGKKSGGERVFDFTLGNPVLEPFPEVREIFSRKDMVAPPGYMGSLGTPETREALAVYYRSKYGIPFKGEDVGFSHGATGALHLILGSIGNEGDNVIFPTPLFGPPYKAWISERGRQARTVTCNGDFSPDAQRIRDAMDERTAGVYINQRNNPTGKMYSEGGIRELTDVCRERNVFLIVDNVYEGMEWNGESPPHWGYENTIEINSISKRLSGAGKRLGWFVLHPDMADKKEIIRRAGSVQELAGYICPNDNVYAIPELLKIPEERIKRRLREYEKRIDALASGLKEIGYDAEKPDSTFYLWFPVPEKYGGDDEKFMMDAIGDAKIGLVYGSDFGEGGKGWIRACVGDIGIPQIEESLNGFERLYRGGLR